jgi:hypothetical protein
MSEDDVTASDTICFMLLDGEVTKCKLDLDTGEWVKVRPYHKKKYKIKAKQDDGTETIYSWSVDPIDIEQASRDEEIRDLNISTETRGRKPKVYDNSYVKSMLSPCQTYDSANKTFPFFDEILVSVANLHDGNKPLSVGLLFKLLVLLDNVSTDTVQRVSNKSERYSRTLSTAVQIASRQLSKKLEGFVFEYADGELPTIDKEQLLIDRKEYIGWFKGQQAKGMYEGFSVPK